MSRLFDNALVDRALAAERAYVALKKEQASLSLLTEHVLEALILQRGRFQSEGFWVQIEALGWMQDVGKEYLGSITTGDGPPKTWVWQKLPASILDSTQSSFIRFKSRSGGGADFQVSVKPFAKQFPFDVFIIILSFADPEARANFAKASFLHYELAMPDMLRSIKIYADAQLRELFRVRVPMLPTSSRLLTARSFSHIKTLEIAADCVSRALDRWAFDFDRLGTSKALLCLDTLKISRWRSYSSSLNRWANRSFFPSGPSPFLRVLNPKNLVLHAKPAWHSEGALGIYDVSKEGADAMSRWSRLREVQLDCAYLSVAPAAGHPPDQSARPDFFLNRRGDVLSDPGSVSVVWNLSWYGELSPGQHRDLVKVLLERHAPVRKPWVTLFTVLVKNALDRKAIQELFDKVKNVPSGLVCEAKQESPE